MPRKAGSPQTWPRTLACSVWLYTRLLRLYPPAFRQAYGSRMLRVFRDSCRAALQEHGLAGWLPLWWSTCTDMVHSACIERWLAFKERATSMTGETRPQHFPLRLWLALSATLLAFLVALVASLNLYMLEDASPLTMTAYAASPLLRFSYDGIYLTALAAGVAVCAIVGNALIPQARLVTIGLGVIAFLVAFGGFGGLLVRHSTTFLAFCIAFGVLLLFDLLAGYAVARRAATRLGRQIAAVLGACVGAGSLLLLNVAALVVHTLILNPVSHALYMQGQIAGTHLNFSLLAMGIAVLTLLICVLSLGGALRLPGHPS